MKFFLKYIVFPLVIFLVAFYFWASGSQLETDELSSLVTYDEYEEGASKDTFRVMTFNIGYLSGMTNNLPVQATRDLHRENLSKSISFLNDVNADIVGFQEIDYGSKRSYMINQMDSLAKYGKYPYGAKGINWDKRYVPFPYWPPSVHFGEMLSGQAVHSRYPILEAKRIAMEKPEAAPFYYNAFYLDRLIQVCTVDIGTPLIILNVHLEAFDTETREKQAKYLLDVFNKYAKDYPVLLIGDFNARPPYASDPGDPESTISSFLSSGKIGQAIPKAMYTQAESEYFTFDTGKPIEKLDYIFYNTDKIQMISAKVPKEAGEISDHLPVVMDFVLIK